MAKGRKLKAVQPIDAVPITEFKDGKMTSLQKGKDRIEGIRRSSRLRHEAPAEEPVAASTRGKLNKKTVKEVLKQSQPDEDVTVPGKKQMNGSLKRSEHGDAGNDTVPMKKPKKGSLKQSQPGEPGNVVPAEAEVSDFQDEDPLVRVHEKLSTSLGLRKRAIALAKSRREAAERSALEENTRQAAERAALEESRREAAERAALEESTRQAAERTALEESRRQAALQEVLRLAGPLYDKPESSNAAAKRAMNVTVMSASEVPCEKDFQMPDGLSQLAADIEKLANQGLELDQNKDVGKTKIKDVVKIKKPRKATQTVSYLRNNELVVKSVKVACHPALLIDLVSRMNEA